jgi:hypothetical protein
MAQTTIQGSFLDSTLDITSLVLSGASPLVFEGATADAYETTLAFVDPTADRVITIPNATDTLLGKATTDTLTNKTFDVDGTGNSLINIANSSIKAAAAIALNKLAATTVSRALVSDGSGFVSASAVTATEIGYLDGVSSAIQTQLGTKQATIDSSARLNSNLIHDGSVTNTEFGYISTLSSNAQTQLTAKAPIASPTFTTGATSPAFITGNSGTLKLVDGDGNHFTTLAAHATTIADVAYTWPNNAPGTSGFALTSTTGGVMSWAAAGGNSFTNDVTVTSGNFVIGTAGKGIDFSATTDYGTTTPSELLDDYEEGTWTPTFIFSGSGSLSYSQQVGTYTKIGNAVTVSFRVALNASVPNTFSGHAGIGGLPFTTHGTARGAMSIGYVIGITCTGTMLMIADLNASVFMLYESSDNALTPTISMGNFVSTSPAIVGGGVYHD